MDILPQLIFNSLIAGSIYALVALGFSFLFSTVKFFDLGYGALAAIGGYGTFFAIKTLGYATFPSVFIGIVAASLVAYLVGVLIYRPLHRKKASSMVMIVASLGVMTALQAIVAILFSSQFQTLRTNISAERIFTFAGGVITQTQIIILLCAVGIFFALALLLKFTMFGKAIRAIGDDEEVAKIVGINTERVIGGVFLISGAIAGLAGILVGFDSGIEPTMGLSLLLKGVVASIIGGIGNMGGALVGAFFLGFVENFGIWKISGEWKDAIAFGILIAFLLFRPHGILKR